VAESVQDRIQVKDGEGLGDNSFDYPIDTLTHMNTNRLRIGIENYHQQSGLYGISQDAKIFRNFPQFKGVKEIEKYIGVGLKYRLRKKIFFAKTLLTGPRKIKYDVLICNSTFPIVAKNEESINIRRLHDVIPLSHPEYFTMKSRLHFRKILKKLETIDNTYFVFPSHFSKTEFQKYSQRIPEKYLRVIPVGIDLNNFSYSNSKKNRIVVVGTIEPRKNVKRIIDSFLELQKKGILVDWELLIVGRKGWKIPHQLKTLMRNPPKSVSFLENEGEREKYKLLSEAKIGICLSVVEGFSITPIEFALSGCSLILSKIPVHYEKFKNFPDDNCRLLNPDDSSGLELSLKLQAEKWSSAGMNPGEISSFAHSSFMDFSTKVVYGQWEVFFEELGVV
jgi:glycosyltransferase involved in cell wall biosynthesis